MYYKYERNAQVDRLAATHQVLHHILIFSYAVET